MEEWERVKSMDRLESDFIAAYEGRSEASDPPDERRASQRRADRDREVVRSSSPSPPKPDEAEQALSEERLHMRRSQRAQVDAATKLIESHSRGIDEQTGLFVALMKTALRERNTMLALGTFATIAAIAFVFLGMFSDPWFLTGAAAMSTIAGGCGYGLQTLRNQPFGSVVPRLTRKADP